MTDMPFPASHASHDILFAAVQMTSMPMVLSDPNLPDCPIVFCNPAFLALTGYLETEVLGRNCRFLQGPLTDQATIQNLRDQLAVQRSFHVEMYNYRRDGSGFWNALYISPVFRPDGSLLYYFGSQLDVTARREAEAALHQARRMEMLGNLAAGIAHEFNNVMTIVISSVEQASIRTVDERQRRQLKRADIGARRAGKITSQMLSFARRQLLQSREVDLNALLRNADAVMAKAAGDGVSIEMRLASGPVKARLDPGQLEVAIVNVLRNAAEAMADGGTVVVSTRLAGPDEPMVELAVKDQGAGMDEATARRATEPFFTTKIAGDATGLGLSVVHGFVGQSGGRMAIKTSPGRGTTVRLFFPEHRPAG